MVNTLSGSVCAYRKETVKPRFIRIDEVMALLDVTQDEAMDIALAAGARYQLAKIILVHKERLMKFMKHSARVPSSNKIVEKKFVRIGEGSMTYSIGHHRFIEMARAAGAVYKIGEAKGNTILINLEVFIIRRQMMGRRLEYEVKTSVRLNMSNPQHVKINDVIQNLDPKIFKSKNQFIIDAIQFYIDNYGKETFVIKKKEKERAEYIRSEDIDDIKEEVIEAATNEARKEVIKLLGGVISGMNVGQPVLMQAANSEAQEPTEDVMDDADVAGLAMGWMSKGD